MHKFKIDDLLYDLEGAPILFCAGGPENAIENVNKLMKVRGRHSNQQPWQDGSLWHQNWVDLRKLMTQWDYKELHHHTIMI